MYYVHQVVSRAGHTQTHTQNTDTHTHATHATRNTKERENVGKERVIVIVSVVEFVFHTCSRCCDVVKER